MTILNSLKRIAQSQNVSVANCDSTGDVLDAMAGTAETNKTNNEVKWFKAKTALTVGGIAGAGYHSGDFIVNTDGTILTVASGKYAKAGFKLTVDA